MTLITIPHGPGWLELTSPALSRLVVLELLAQPAQYGLSEEVQDTLAKAVQAIDNSDKLPPALQRLGVFINTQSLQVIAARRGQARWRQAALTYLVLRQAHFPLLRALFDCTRAEVAEKRKETGAPLPPLRHQEIDLPVLQRLWREWQSICAEYESEAERWVVVAQRWPEYPLATLYQALVVDAGGSITSTQSSGAAK